ncbi:hypothetical protein KFL_002820065 [Klebsormidium nitens]|uniref:Uncharacterized protein n=1 Tax=Klebsormidium nitens TaxID=105231 RepID=A0A1Y1IB11_KLENI|nr:hypothetical protein KFL_002820065 [Klebsormidium nitens]|eukprot:GAQ86311.1 hypothetical protein KFL_002820065 [Klebsormidium nitens]
MTSKAESSRLPLFSRWGRTCPGKARCSSSTITSPLLTTSVESPSDFLKANMSEQTTGQAPSLEPGTVADAKLVTAVSTLAAASDVKALGQQNENLRARVAVLAKEKADARSEADTLQAENAALRQEMSEKEKGFMKEVSELEEVLEKQREACRRSEDERERFQYVLACTGQEGSVPRSVLASAPDSLLFEMFYGECDYARDDQGRALITCHPERWTAVLEHLATGAVPAESDPLLLAQARHWKLNRLVEGLEALISGVTVTNDEEDRGFKARCTLVSVMEKLSGGKGDVSYTFPGPQGRLWAVKISTAGVMLGSLVPRTLQPTNVADLKGIKVSPTFRVLLRTEALVQASVPVNFPSREESFRGFAWLKWGYGLQQLLSEPLAKAHGNLVIEVEVRYED